MSFDDHIRAAIDRALTEVRAPLDGTLRELADTVAAQVRASSERLSDALRALDGSRSFGEVLTRLTACAGREADRSAVLIVAAGRLKGWRWSGFGVAEAGAKVIDSTLDEGGLVGAAVSTKTTIVSPASGQRTSAVGLPPFARGVGERDAAAMPVVLDGVVAAVLYVDAPAVGGAPPWSASVDLLARYAGLLLEARTARYLTGLSPESPRQDVSDRDHLRSKGAR